ncbi:hypothetical protein AMS68_004706 [Peltaster fructicola]|uniref:DH domain-containing protein n=1 Tax=Peltaster fructicola TaxID=286661 RepID=A0A6H0XX43_9PEZI|nr:hypothetical protein AMS68_004706 [Peltaster fructicola]
MATVVSAPPALSGDLSLFHTTDPFLANAPLLLFHGPAATVGAASSRIQLHIFTIAGHASYTRLAISPNSPFYTAVSNLPREEQGDEICRGIAFGLRKYFEELSTVVKTALCTQVRSTTPQMLFGDNHVAILASRLKRVENIRAVAEEIVRSFAEQKVPWLDVDVVLPPGTIKGRPKRTDSAGSDDLDESRVLSYQYGKYADIVATFGSTAFLPTSRMKRAPSQVSSIGRTASFMRQQRENARKEVSELVTTEASYVSRVQELQQIRDNVQSVSVATAHGQLSDIFPASLDSIAAANQSLLAALQKIEDETANSSRNELAAMANEQPTAQQIRQDLLEDNQGIGAIAKCLCEVLPDLAASYESYMKDHVAATLLLKNFTRSPDSTVQASIQEVGEQKLTSLLIEPVQRLPRYNLYIDSISKQLPTRHPALKHLLKAKDIVTSICDQGDAGDVAASLSDRLRIRAKEWPDDLQVSGRLVTTVDYVELRPPYNLEKNVVHRGILLLFTDSIVLLAKSEGQPTSARSLMTELEALTMRRTHACDLTFVECVSLRDVECSTSHEGQSVQLTLLPQSAAGAQQSAESILTLLLEGSYEAKASRLLEEITKARVEAQFSEAERESTGWEVRATDSLPEQVQLFSAVFEDSNSEHISQRNSSAPVRVIIDIDKHSQKVRAGTNGIHTVIAVSPLRDSSCRLSIECLDGQGGSEQIPLAELATTVRRRLGFILALRHGIERPALTQLHIDRCREILESIDLALTVEDNAVAAPVQPAKPQHRGPLRPLSPVKMLSSFLSSTGPGGQPPITLKKEPSGSSIMSAAASFSMLPGSRSNTSIVKPPSREGRPAWNDQLRPKSSASMQSFEKESNVLKKLEETFSAYVLALQARKGNIVGRSLKMRATADELAVNELYNVLLENHQMMVSAAQATVDVLFAAFEKFLSVAWREHWGPVIPILVLQDIQAKAETQFPADFDQHCRASIRALSPPNQRAFKSIINLLNELLDGTGNDADRGALTAAFAELLVPEGNAHDFVSLIDRFVDDAETYFGEPLPEQTAPDDSSMSMGSHKRSRSVNTGSLTSNTSSLRRKFGLGLSRENSKSEHDSKGSVWRTLSKSRRDASPAESLAPVSQDGPLTRKNISGDTLQVPIIASSTLPGLSTIGEHPSFIPTGPPRKKRRSSLSDLKMLDTPFVTPQRPMQSPPARQAGLDKSLPTSPIPSTPSSKGGSLQVHSPTRSQRLPIPAAFRKENSPIAANVAEQSHDPDAKTSATRLRQSSNIPSLAPRTASPLKMPPPVTPVRGGLTERNDAGNIVRKPSVDEKITGTPALKLPAGSPTKKLRMQSPQKIRERLQTEQSAIVAAHSNLQDELSKISDELASTPSRLVPNRSVHGSLHRPQSTSNIDVTAKVLKMESAMTDQIAQLTVKLEKIQSDLSSSLTVSENKCKKLDELYRESNAENEALYSRFNSELARVSRAVRAGEGVEELKRRLKEQEDEVGRLKKENVRLKREVVGLRAQLKE